MVVSIGCAKTTKSKKLRKVSLGMNKEQVVSDLGEPAAVRGAVKNKYGQVIEVWEYKIRMPSTDSTGEKIGKGVLTYITIGMAASMYKNPLKDYWFYFLSDNLVQWGEAGDWSKEQKQIYEIKYNQGPNL